MLYHFEYYAESYHQVIFFIPEREFRDHFYVSREKRQSFEAFTQYRIEIRMGSKDTGYYVEQSSSLHAWLPPCATSR